MGGAKFPDSGPGSSPRTLLGGSLIPPAPGLTSTRGNAPDQIHKPIEKVIVFFGEIQPRSSLEVCTDSWSYNLSRQFVTHVVDIDSNFGDARLTQARSTQLNFENYRMSIASPNE